jgi:hypothetical protein
VRESVFLVGVASPDNAAFHDVGTAWTISPKYLATNAHVAEALVANRGANGRLVARRGVFDQNEVVLGDPVIHPAYGYWNPRLGRMIQQTWKGLEQFSSQPVADVAILPVTVGDPGTPLQALTDEDLDPLPGDEVYYIGYPSETLSGFAALQVVAMRVTARTDIFFRPTDWRGGALLHLSGQAVGGASGSPVLTGDGNVIGILSSGDFVLGQEGRRVGVGFAYAQKVDLALELVDGTAEARQQERDQLWQQTIRRGIFARPERIIEELMAVQVRKLRGADSADPQLVTQQNWQFSPAEERRSLNLRLEPGYEYCLVAVADDGTDIDSTLREGTRVIGEDTAADHFPFLTVPVADGGAVDAVYEVYAAERVPGPMQVHARIYRYAAAAQEGQSTTAASGEVDAFIQMMAVTGNRETVTQTVEAGEDGAHVQRVRFRAEESVETTVLAVSQTRRDIDLVAKQNDAVLDSDLATDHYPILEFVPSVGEVSLELTFPPDSQEGESVSLHVWQRSGAGGGPAAAPESDLAAYRVVVFADDRAVAERIGARLSGIGFNVDDPQTMANDTANVKWGSAPRDVVDLVVEAVADVTGLPDGRIERCPARSTLSSGRSQRTGTGRRSGGPSSPARMGRMSIICGSAQRKASRRPCLPCRRPGVTSIWSRSRTTRCLTRIRPQTTTRSWSLCRASGMSPLS